MVEGCRVGIAALSIEALLILLAAWQARSRHASIALPLRPAAYRTPEYSHLG